MILSDWISNIRWKYFTNSKSGLIFKELMKEFWMVEAMTENVMYICGLSMEMELAEEMGTIGKCMDCIHHQVITDDTVDCEIHGRIPVRTDCRDWLVDYR